MTAKVSPTEQALVLLERLRQPLVSASWSDDEKVAKLANRGLDDFHELRAHLTRMHARNVARQVLRGR
jgi:hypothetical protein